MKLNGAIKLLALVSALACLLVWAPAQAAAHTTSSQQPPAVTATASGSSDSGSSGAFSKKDVMVLAAGATCLVALGVGFRRFSAPLE